MRGSARFMRAPWRPLLRDFASELMLRSGLVRPEKAGVGALTVVTFHRVLPKAQLADYPLSEIAVTPEEMGWFARFFASYYTAGPLDAIHTRWRNGDTPERPFLAITFDDGQLDNYLHARPALEKAGLRGSFFVPVDAIDENATLWHDRLAYAGARWLQKDSTRARGAFRELGSEVPEDDHEALLSVIETAKKMPPGPRLEWVEHVERASDAAGRPKWDGMMSWDQLREMVKAGHEVGSHSASHEILPLLDDKGLEHEVTGTKKRLETALDVPCPSFCYPNGDTDTRVTAAVARSGYRQAVTTKWGPNRTRRSPFLLTRCDVQGGARAQNARGALSEAKLAFRLSPYFPPPY